MRSTIASRCGDFAKVELGDDVVPDETTIMRFRHLLQRHGLGGAIFVGTIGLLEARGRCCARDDRGCDHHRGVQLDQTRTATPR